MRMHICISRPDTAKRFGCLTLGATGAIVKRYVSVAKRLISCACGVLEGVLVEREIGQAMRSGMRIVNFLATRDCGLARAKISLSRDLGLTRL
jgi:hypothetical protein